MIKSVQDLLYFIVSSFIGAWLAGRLAHEFMGKSCWIFLVWVNNPCTPMFGLRSMYVDDSKGSGERGDRKLTKRVSHLTG